MYCLHGTAVWKLKPPSVWPPVLQRHGGSHERCGSGRKSRSTNNTAHRLSGWQTVTGSWYILVEVRVCTEAMARGRASLWPTLGAAAWLFWGGVFCCFFLYANYSCQIPPLDLKMFNVGPLTVSHLWTVICLFAHPPFTGWQKSDVKYFGSSPLREKGWCLFSTSGFHLINANLIASWKCVLPVFIPGGFILQELCHALITFNNMCSSVFVLHSFQTINHPI